MFASVERAHILLSFLPVTSQSGRAGLSGCAKTSLPEINYRVSRPSSWSVQMEEDRNEPLQMEPFKKVYPGEDKSDEQCVKYSLRIDL